MHQCEVSPATESTPGSSLHLENKGPGEEVTATDDVAAAGVSANPGVLELIQVYRYKKSKVLSRASRAHRVALISVSCSPQPDTSRSCKTTDTGPVHHVVCPFTPQLSLVLIN